MKKMRAGAFTAAFLLVAGLAFAADNSTSVKIDYKMDVAKKNKANYFNWTVGNGETVKDKFDAVSGASMKGSTKGFNVVRYSEPAEDKKAAIPSGLRVLFLFAINDWNLAENCALKVTKTDGVITARFARKDTVFELKTGKDGKFDLLTGARKAKGVIDKTEDGKFMIKPEYLKTNGDPSKMSDLDWDRVEYVLEADTFDSDAAYHYESKLNFMLKGSVLSVSGTMERM
ncbi:MAG: hypothetical protein ACTTKL_03040 [Treponema sp.]